MRPALVIPGLLLVAGIALDAAVLEFAKSDMTDALLMLVRALSSAQVCLLAVWLALGPAPLPVRLIVCLTGFAACQAAFVEPRANNLLVGLGILFAFLAERAWARYLWQPTGRAASEPRAGRPQFSLADLLLLIATAAVGLAFGHYFRSLIETDTASKALFVLVQITLGLLTTWAILATRVSLVRLAAPFAVAIALVAIRALWMVLAPLDEFYAVATWICQATILMAALLALRSAGLRWRPGVRQDGHPGLMAPTP
jgi:F0F1-type ATP synthase membrane subunit c/vacuolar-type H+-ATPase subunit K